MANPSPSKERWGSRVGVILAVTGSAVGLGNFLRFPGLAAKYDGGAFMIPYTVAFLLLGLPIAWTEWAMGRYGGARGFNSTPGIFRTIWKNRAAPYAGVLGMLIPVMIYMYYVFIEAWCLGYAWEYLTGGMAFGKDAAKYGAFFESYVGAAQDGAIFERPQDTALWALGVCFVLNFVLIYRGINKGIEWFCKWAMPALIVCALIVLVRVLTLGTPDAAKPDQSLINGLGYMWNPNTPTKSLWESLQNSQMWLDAAGQIFFSLSVGFGIMITYASYLKPDDDVALSSVTAASGNGFCEVVLGGMITIPAAVVFLGPTVAQNASGTYGITFGLGFVTLPLVFAHMPFGQFFGFLFFFLLFLAAVTSSLSMLQPAIALLEEGLGLGRRASVSLLGFITLMGTGFVVYFSKGFTALDTIDFWVANVCIYILATVQVILFGWVLGIDKGIEELDRGSEIRIPRMMKYVIKYISPLFLLTLFAVWVYQKAWDRVAVVFNNRVAAMSVGFIGVVILLFVFLVAQSVKRWERAERAQREVRL